MKIMNKLFILLTASVIMISCGGEENNSVLSASGTAEITRVSIASPVPGKLLKIFVKEGSAVKKGDTIAVIDHEKLEYQLRLAEANLAIAQAQYDLLKNGARKEDVASVKAAYNLANANFQVAKKDLDRIKKLFNNKSAPEKQLDDAQTRFKIALAQLQQAKAAKLKMRNFARPEELAKAKAAVEAAQASVDLAKTNINDATVISPTDGLIKEFFYETGEMIPAYSVLCDVLNSSEAEVEIYISELDLGKVKKGMKAKIFSDSYPEDPVLGVVTKISEEAEFTPKTIQTKEERTKLVYKITIKAPNGENKLKGGMPVDVEIILNEADN